MLPRRLDLPPRRRPRRRHRSQRRHPLARQRLPPDPALGAGQGGADPLRRRPAGAQAEAGALAGRDHALPPRRRRLLPADHAAAGHGDDDGDRLLGRRHPGRRRRAPGRPRQDRPRDRRPGAADGGGRALPDGAPHLLPQPRAPTPAAPASRRRRRRSPSAPAASSATGSATASRRPSTCPRPTPT